MPIFNSPKLGSLFDLQVHEDIGKQNIFNLFNEVTSSALVNTTKIILSQAKHMCLQYARLFTQDRHHLWRTW